MRSRPRARARSSGGRLGSRRCRGSPRSRTSQPSGRRATGRGTTNSTRFCLPSARSVIAAATCVLPNPVGAWSIGRRRPEGERLPKQFDGASLVGMEVLAHDAASTKGASSSQPVVPAITVSVAPRARPPSPGILLRLPLILAWIDLLFPSLLLRSRPGTPVRASADLPAGARPGSFLSARVRGSSRLRRSSALSISRPTGPGSKGSLWRLAFPPRRACRG